MGCHHLDRGQSCHVAPRLERASRRRADAEQVACVALRDQFLVGLELDHKAVHGRNPAFAHAFGSVVGRARVQPSGQFRRRRQRPLLPVRERVRPLLSVGPRGSYPRLLRIKVDILRSVTGMAASVRSESSLATFSCKRR